MSDKVPMTREGYEKLRAELTELEEVQMPEITKRIAAKRLATAAPKATIHKAFETRCSQLPCNRE